MTWFVYILLCVDGSYYVGLTHDLHARVTLHNAGRGATYTAAHRPVRLVYTESFSSRADAEVRERQLKRWTHVKKQALIAGDLAHLRDLAKSRD